MIDSIPCRPLNHDPVFPNLQLMAIETRQDICRWLFLGIHKPPSQGDNEFMSKLSLVIDH